MVEPSVEKPERTRRRKVVRFMGWTLGGVVALLLVLVVGVVLGVLGSLSALDKPIVADRVARVIRSQTGLRVTYTTLDVAPFSGLRIEGLRVMTPPRYQDHAPELVRLDGLELGWSVWPLLSGRIQVDPLRVEGLSIHLVVDRAGGSSLDGLAPGPPAEPEKAAPAPPAEPTPLSGLLARALPAMHIQRVSLRGLRAELIEVADGAVVRRIEVSGPELEASVQAQDGKLDLAASLRGDADAGGVRVVVEDTPAGQATRKREALLDLDLALRTPDSSTVALTLALSAVRQNLIEGLPEAGPLAKLKAEIGFDPDGHRTLVSIEQADLLQGAATARLNAELVEADSGVVAPQVNLLQADLDATRILEALEIELPGLELSDVSLQVSAEKVGLSPQAKVPLRGSFSAQARVAKAAFERDGQRATVAGLTIDLKGRAGDLKGRTGTGGGLDVRASVGADRIEAARSSGGERTDGGTLSGLKLDLRADGVLLDASEPMNSKGVLTVRGSIDSAAADQAGQRVQLAKLGLEAESRLTGQLPLAGKVRLPIERVTLTGGGLGKVDLNGLDLVVAAGELFPDFSKPSLAEVDLGLAGVRMHRRGERIAAKGFRLHTRVRLIDPHTFSALVQVPVERLDLHQGRSIALGLRKLDLELKIDDARLPAGAPEKASAKVALRTSLGKLTAGTPGLDAAGQGLGLQVDARLVDGALGELTGAVPIRSLQVTRGPKKVRVASVAKGRLGLRLDQVHFVAENPVASRARLRADLRAERLGLRPGTSFGLASLDLRVSADGRRRRFDGELGLVLTTPEVDGRSVDAAPEVALKADLDLRQPRAALSLDLTGQGAPRAMVEGQADFDRATRRVTWELKADLASLGLVGAFLPASLVKQHRLAWDRLGLKLSSNGGLTGVVEGFRGLAPRLADEPLVSARGELKLDLEAVGLGYRRDELALDLPGLDVHLRGRRSQKDMDAEVRLSVPRAKIETGSDQVALTGLKQQVVIDTQGRVRTGRVRLTASTAIEGLEQSFVVGYPVADARLEARVVVDRLASLRLEQFRLANPAGGTEFTLLAAIDRLQDLVGDLPAGRIAGRQALGLSGSLRQELSKLALFGQGGRASGRVTIPFRVESGDLEAFRLAARLEAENVGLDLPAAGLSLAGFRGRMPIIEDVARKADGSFKLLAGPPGNPYSRARFLDVHPFLKGENFLAVERLGVLGQEIGPVAGNVRVSWGSLAVDQLQVAWKQGKITGQLAADYGGGRPKLFFKGNATGIRPSQSADILDANATLDFTPDPLGLSGRVQVVRIGKQHLLDVLDWIDPYHESVDVNRVRLGLTVGFPKFLRIRMQNGFLSAKVELGGVAGVVRIDEIRGVALGPLLERYVAPVLK